MVVVQAACLYWDIDSGVWSDDGCVVKSQTGTSVVCSCTHLTDFATAFTETLATADWSALGNFSLFTIDNILENPLPFILLFVLYFLAGVGCVLGTNVDSQSKTLSSLRIVHIHQFRAFKEVPRKPSGRTKLLRAFFLTSNCCLVLLSVAVFIVGASSFESTFNWIFGDLGNFILITYGCFQLLVTVIGPFIIGMFKGFGAYRPLFTLWLVLCISFLLMNYLALEFAQHETINVPGSFCIGVDTAWCERDVIYVFGTFWNSTKVEAREQVLEMLPVNTTCSQVPEVPMTNECAYDLYAQFDGYLLFMGMSHIVMLSLLIPSGIFSYLQWSSWRKRNKHMVPLSVSDQLKQDEEDRKAQTAEEKSQRRSRRVSSSRHEEDTIATDELDDQEKTAAPASLFKRVIMAPIDAGKHIVTTLIENHAILSIYL
jgi:hypothetical protein